VPIGRARLRAGRAAGGRVGDRGSPSGAVGRVRERGGTGAASFLSSRFEKRRSSVAAIFERKTLFKSITHFEW
jgi:hypothetical protein